MKRAIAGACVTLAFTVALGAQDRKTETMDHMAVEKTYSGCVERSPMGTYTLTHSMMADAKMPTKQADSMKKGDNMMKTDAMKMDDAMAHDSMAAASLALSSAARGVDFSKQVGHKVTVTGTDGDTMNGMATFKVKSLKMISRSCS